MNSERNTTRPILTQKVTHLRTWAERIAVTSLFVLGTATEAQAGGNEKILPVPFFSQDRSLKTCGQTSAEMVLAYFGKKVPLQTLISESHSTVGLTPDGVASLLNKEGLPAKVSDVMVTGGDYWYFNERGVKITVHDNTWKGIDSWSREIEQGKPFLVGVKNAKLDLTKPEVDHWMVAVGEGTNGGITHGFYVNDPLDSEGPRFVTDAQLGAANFAWVEVFPTPKMMAEALVASLPPVVLPLHPYIPLK